MPFEKLFSPIDLGPVTVRNRIVNPANNPGLVFLEERAKGGVGLLVISGPFSQGVDTYSAAASKVGAKGAFAGVMPSPATPEGKTFYDQRITPQVKTFAETMHKHGAKAFGQLYNLGVLHPTSSVYKVAPTAMAGEIERQMAHELTTGEVRELVYSFGQGARRLKEGGMDGMEFHGAHSYIIHEFMSPYFNKRTDQYGGSFNNRMRFLDELFEEVRGQVGPDFPIGLRINGESFAEGELHNTDAIDIAKRYESKVVYISVSIGNYVTLKSGVWPPYVAPWLVPAGYIVPYAAAIKAAIKKPVIVSGRILSPEQAEQIIADGKADMVGMVRSLYADPNLPNKAMAGNMHNIRPCIGLNECHSGTGGCAVHSEVGHEDELIGVTAAPTAKRVLVVGAGPAGSECARIAVQRGHKVTLVDRENFLGGRPYLLGNDPTRPEIHKWIKYLDVQVKRLGVELKLGTNVDAQFIDDFKPDAVVIATGADEWRPEIPGINGANVVLATEVFRGTATLGKNVVVVGGYDDTLSPLTTADLIARKGHNVELISQMYAIGEGIMDNRVKHLMLKRLMDEKVKLTNLTELKGIGAKHLDVLNQWTREPRRIENVDTVVLAAGQRVRMELENAIKDKGIPFYRIGDAHTPRRIIHATLDGARVARLV